LPVDVGRGHLVLAAVTTVHICRHLPGEGDLVGQCDEDYQRRRAQVVMPIPFRRKAS
jgi:hypothetical protein